MRFSAVVRRAFATGVVAGLLGAGLTVTAPAAGATEATIATAPAGTLTTVTPGLRGYDSGGVETPTQIACLSAGGYSFDIVNANGTTWQNEYNAAAAAGMTVILFQGYDPTAWARAGDATTRAVAIRDKAIAAGYPRGGEIFLNLEDTVQTGVTPTGLLSWVKNWATVIRAAGYVPGVYVGVPQLLTAAQVNSISGVVFWRSASSSAPQASRGYVVRQPGIAQPACSIQGGIDTDVAGTDGTGSKLIGASFPRATPTPDVAGGFYPLPPTRLLDTRSGLGGAGPVGQSHVVNLQVTGRGGVPTTGVAAVVLNVTLTAPTAIGFITAYAEGQQRPTVSTLNFSAGQTVANLATVPVGPTGQVTLFNGSAPPKGNPGTVQLIADVAGYYTAGTAAAPGTFAPVPPSRLLDTRPGGVAAGSVTNLLLPGPAGNTPFDSAVLNVTAVAPATAGYVSVFPAGTPAPTASNLNFAPAQTVPNMVTVKVGTDGSAGRISLYNGSAGRANLLADVSGYYLSGQRTNTGTFTPLAPTRILDSRTNIGVAGKIPAASGISLLVRGRGGVPANASAVVLTATVVHQMTSGYLTVFPSDRSAPVASNIDFVSGKTVANQVIVPIGADGRIVLVNQSAGTTDLLADVAGYFQS